MDRKHGAREKAENGLNPLWVIVIAMAIFFAAAALVMARG
jgi:hypothetical protein